MKRTFILGLVLLLAVSVMLSACEPDFVPEVSVPKPKDSAEEVIAEVPIEASKAKETTVVIGFTSSITGKQEVSSKRQVNGFNLWMNEVNAAGGVTLSDGTVLSDIAVYCYNGTSGPTTVGSLDANTWGLHDVHGNVWEWCHDGWDGDDYAGDTEDPSGDESASERVGRGGSWYHEPRKARSAERQSNSPDTTNGYLGIRLVRIE